MFAMSSRRADVKVKLQHKREREREIESLVQSAAVSCIRTEISFEALERETRDRTRTPTTASMGLKSNSYLILH